MHKHHRNRHVHAITSPADRTPLGSLPVTRAEALRALGEVVYAARLADHVHHGREWYYPTPGVLAVVNEMRERLGLEPVAA